MPTSVRLKMCYSRTQHKLSSSAAIVRLAEHIDIDFACALLGLAHEYGVSYQGFFESIEVIIDVFLSNSTLDHSSPKRVFFPRSIAGLA